MIIPKVAHMIWVGPPIPPHLVEMAETFSVHHPDWRLRWWTEPEIEVFGLRNGDHYANAEMLVPADSVPQLRSDLARYEILYRLGGMYLDCDYRWQASIEPHLGEHELVTAWEVDGHFVANGIIAAVPGHAALAEVIGAARKRIRLNRPSWRANRLTGPHVWTPVARKHAHILPSALVNPAPHNHPEWAVERPYPDAVAVHHWHHQRTLRGIAP